MKIARVFPRRTNATPRDPLAFSPRPGRDYTDAAPGLWPPKVDAVHISVSFEWDLVGGRPIMATAPQPATPPLMPMLPQEVKLPPCVNTHVTGPSQALCEAAYSPIEYVWMLVRLSTGPGCHEPRVCPAGSIAAVRPEVGTEWTENGWAVWVINLRRVA